jgi:hypothetical protein
VTSTFETPARPRLPFAAIALIGIAGITLVLTFVVAGFAFMGLAIAFPIAVPFAERFSLYMSPADIELAKQFADFSWLFGVASVLSFAAALGSMVAVIKALSPTSDR